MKKNFLVWAVSFICSISYLHQTKAQFKQTTTTGYTYIVFAYGPDGNIYLARQEGAQDTARSMVERFSPDGESLGVFIDQAGIQTITSLAFDKFGNLYLAGVKAAPAPSFTSFCEKFSSRGKSLGIVIDNLENGTITSLACDPSESLYVLISPWGDGKLTNVIRKFSSSGKELNVPISLETDYETQLLSRLACDSLGNLYISNVRWKAGKYNSNILKFLPYGEYRGIFAWLPCPLALVFDSNDNLYVATYSTSNGIEKFSSQGKWLSTFATSLFPIDSLALDTRGNFYAACSFDQKTEKFSSTGTWLGSFPPQNLWDLNNGLKITGSSGGEIDHNLEFIFGGPAKWWFELPKREGTFSDGVGRKGFPHWIEWEVEKSCVLSSYQVTLRSVTGRRKISEFSLFYYNVFRGWQLIDKLSVSRNAYDHRKLKHLFTFKTPLYAQRFRAVFVQAQRGLLEAPKIDKLEAFGFSY